MANATKLPIPAARRTTKSCEVLRESSRFVRHWIQAQPAVKEESLTDWLLFDLSNKSTRFAYTAFDRHTEARLTGADWEWWILLDSATLRLRVQAKKLFPNADNYSAIAYSNRYGLQIDRLRDASNIVNAMAFYAFYTGSADTSMCKLGVLDEGVYLSSAERLHTDFIAAGRTRVMQTDALFRSTPLSCLACCPAMADNLDPKDFFRMYHPSVERAHSGSNSDYPGFYKSVPSFVASFLEHSNEGLPGWWEQEFQSHLRDINALLVYDGRGEVEGG